jgi:phage repressor protein C with HTH and peptisase S24 domain
VEKWAQAMGVNAQWLAHGDAAIIAVPSLGCSAAGGGAWNDSAESRGTVWFDRRTLAALVRGDAVCAEIVGESMEPLILSGDIVLVDRAANVPRKRRGRWRIYAIRESTGEISAKRLVWQRNQWELHSDHPDYAPRKLEYVAGDQSPILGEIVWLCRRLV